MATYKVIQDIEAEDKLIWQLSFRQFVYALIAAVFLYFSYLFITSHVAFLMILTMPMALFCGFLSYPFGKDQPTEVWALAKLRFFIKPRRRIWAQSGVKELVTITVPKKAEVDLTKGLSQTEVKSRLQALADTIDSRGWTIKNVDSVYASPLTSDSPDRLISSSVLTGNSEPADLASAEDMLDVKENPVAQKMDQLLTGNASKRRQELIDNLDKMREEESVKKDGAINLPTVSTGNNFAYTASTDDGNALSPSASDQLLEEELDAKEKRQHLALNNMRTLRSARTTPSQVTNKPEVKPTADGKDPDILNLARRNDLNVAVIGHEINRARGTEPDSPDEVTISLH